ncbi:hypothetical protein D6850_18300 [Roseovarius spongiae]|uniref:Neutral/alkaline non-lysosomal ceramidase N-terminal domain-containing protein n=1 Tax=Roseovarius spongiae TaxID=2320272 RepID=A0A3A8B7A2_9RHOB|nr:hypothetical protein [Roseovarius spongiae]RKF12421.1 hypothetical protein D6850_18300 [Roseovarius spongiae]
MSVPGLEIATARVDITPAAPVPLAGYAARRGVSDIPVPGTLEAAITGLRPADASTPPVWLISCDTLFADTAFERAVVRAAGLIDARCMILVASHTHGAPSLNATAITGSTPAPEYRAEVVQRLGQTVASLNASGPWRPVERITRASGPGPATTNRRRVGLYFDRPAGRLRYGCHYGHNPQGARDPMLHALTFHAPDGPAAIWWCLAAHPAFYPDMRAVSADFPGALRASLSLSHPEAAISFLPGLSGSVIPAVPRHPPLRAPWRRALLSRLPLIPGLGGFTPDSYAAWCATLIAAWNRLQPKTVSGTLFGPFALRLRRTETTSVFRAGDPAMPMILTRLDIAGQTILFLNGEPLAEWQPILAPFLPPGAILTGYAAGPTAYFAPPDCLAAGGYEVDGFQSAFGLTGRMSPDAAETVTDTLKTLV